MQQLAMWLTFIISEYTAFTSGGLKCFTHFFKCC
ncbi:hypothetical protein PANT111_50016 [Pantoea brenneri]|uniref:Uncharacterized protein n=1 Tax=Pantoea brenneri TaxID=472694 RepID=A0AAX3JBU4_9GAMM|nr:hypothetical protein PANT111_50016 [Pantoea brenneri]